MPNMKGYTSKKTRNEFMLPDIKRDKFCLKKESIFYVSNAIGKSVGPPKKYIKHLI